MAVPLPGSTDVIIRDSAAVVLFTVRTTQNVDISWNKELTEVEEIGDVEPALDDFRMTRQTFKINGELVSAAGALPAEGNAPLRDQYNQFKTTLDTNDLLEIRITNGDGDIISERGHFISGGMTLDSSTIFKWQVSFDFTVGQIYNRL